MARWLGAIVSLQPSSLENFAADVNHQLTENEMKMSNGINNSDLSNFRHPNSQRTIIVDQDALQQGVSEDGRMSAVRRFFCLFVTFDIFFMLLLWLICTVATGLTLRQAFRDEVLHYDIETCMFDVFLVSAVRFTCLTLAYALLRLNHWWVVALTTAGSCGFLIAKVFLYNFSAVWTRAYTFNIFLMVASFVISWTEAWFYDCRVIPAEKKAFQIVNGMQEPTERSSLLYRYLQQNNYTAPSETVGTFYSSPGSPIGSECNFAHYDEADRVSVRSQSLTAAFKIKFVSSQHKHEELFRHTGDLLVTCKNEQEQCSPCLVEAKGTTQLTAVHATAIHFPTCLSVIVEMSMANESSNKKLHVLMELEFKQIGKETLEIAWKLINSDGWKIERKSPSGDTVHSKRSKEAGKMFLLSGEVEVNPEVLLEELFYKMEECPKWNPTLLYCKVLQKMDSHTDISYNVAAEGAGGLVAARDFVTLRHWELRDGVYISCGIAVTHPDMPPQKKYTRGENGPGAWIIRIYSDNPHKCQFQWLLNTNLKGWIPQYLVDQALSGVLLEYIGYIRKHTAKLQEDQLP
ncbi:StAR-related lipid transfer protein 3 [Nymphon striatum]|nr:StAR-related lipid transfer protein 3 [Nymphon striatum]